MAHEDYMKQLYRDVNPARDAQDAALCDCIGITLEMSQIHPAKAAVTLRRVAEYLEKAAAVDEAEQIVAKMTHTQQPRR